jgi:hypothetical protein
MLLTGKDSQRSKKEAAVCRNTGNAGIEEAKLPFRNFPKKRKTFLPGSGSG